MLALRTGVLAAAVAGVVVLAHSAGPSRLGLLGPVASDLLLRGRAPSSASAGWAVSASPSSGLRSGDTVVLSFSSPSPKATDLILAYSPYPADGNLSAHAPVEWFVAGDADPSYVTTGAGSVPARLINMRDSYSFVIATGDEARPAAMAVSGNVTFANANEARGARLALTGKATEMRVSWSSAATTGSPRVTFSPAGEEDAAAQVVVVPVAASLTYGAEDMCGPPATTVGYRSPGFIHTAVLTGLSPGQRYTYTVGDDSSTAGPYTFRQPPLGASSPDSFPYVFTAVGDVGQLTDDGSQQVSPFPPSPNTSMWVARDITEFGSNAHLHSGDISYARGYGALWDVFLHQNADVNQITARVAFMTNQGNHERDSPGSAPPVSPGGGFSPSWLNGTDSGGECGVPSATQFPMPTPDGVLASRDVLWWASAMGPVFTLHFSSELDTTPGGPLWAFVKSALESVDRSVTPFVLVATHRPMYISSTNNDPLDGDQTVAEVLRANIEPLLMNAGGSPVDLMIQGHHHSYQRGSAVYNMTVMAHSSGPQNVYKGGLAPVQFVIGTGGAGFSTNVQSPQPDWAEVVEFWHGYARITVWNASALQWQFINDVDGEVWDEAWIVK